MAPRDADAGTSTRRSSTRKRRTTSRRGATTTDKGKRAERTERPTEQDAPDLDELRRSRVEYYERLPERKIQVDLRPKTKTTDKRPVRSSEKKSSSRRESVRRTAPSKSSTKSPRKAQSSGDRYRDGYVYDTSTAPPLERPESSSQAGNRTFRRNNYDYELDSVLSNEDDLLMDIPPAAPDPPPPATTAPTSVSRTSSRKISVSQNGRSSKPVSRRSSTSSRPADPVRRRRRVSEPPLPIVPESPPVATARPQEKRRSIAIGVFFGAKSKPAPKPAAPSQVECLTCSSTKSPNRTAVLECGHIMCHSCLKHLFSMSVTDPQHMPPRCCTSQHIPLKHVDKLFDYQFKSRWNKKYLEYTTKNRLYCPGRGCGTWIAPQNTRKSTVDPKRLIGTCPKCKTRACGACGRKWHTNPDCNAGVRSQEAREFARMAADSGWQRCYNCTATVELREGCNHMTCRCGAQFCMLCGARWKECDCPWFNHNAMDDDDRFIDGAARYVEPVMGQAGGARGYADEMTFRREQERRDAEVARRMQGLEINEWEDHAPGRPRTPEMERDWGGNDTFGFGNMAGHFLNDNFVQRATAILTQTMSPETRDAANRLADEIRTGRAPPLPDGAVVDPVADAFRPPAGQDHGVVGADGTAHEATPRSRHRRTRSRRHASASDIPVDPEAAPPKSRHRARVRLPENDTRRSSVLAGLATAPGEGRVEQWVQHIESDEAREG